jgi:pimeloyl-ACP methyl ester carboxylesterase
MALATAPPLPPVPMPPARTVTLPGRGEIFLRDTHPEGGRPVVVLLHGWIVCADVNWWMSYGPLAEAGWRVIAPDHRGHGRGMRPRGPFRLTDCADDAAALLRALGIPAAAIVGYSLGGTIAQLFARDHRELATGLVLSGTCQHFQDDPGRRAWPFMGVLAGALSVAGRRVYRWRFRSDGIAPERAAWLLSELERGSPRELAEAGRELGRFDSRPWLSSLELPPAAVVVTGRDTQVAPRKQHELAAAARATVSEVALDHLELTERADVFNAALLAALAALPGAPSAGAPAAG